MNKEDTYTVYKHIIPSKITGYDFDKYYIGVTKNDVKKRWGSNGYGYKNHNILFYKAIKKYGWDNIIHVIVKENLSREQAFTMEKQLIKDYSSNDKVHGYNLSEGGEGPNGYRHTEERKRKISLAGIGNHYAKGKNIGNQNAKGNHLSEETRNKMSRSRMGNTNNGISLIRCIETGEIHRAREWIKLGYANAYNVANGKSKSCKKLHFERVS